MPVAWSRFGPIHGALAPRLRLWVDGVEQDLVSVGISGINLQISYAHPARLAWRMHQPQQTLPIPYGASIVFTDEIFGGFETPLFEGAVHEISPADSLLLEYVAYDPTRRAAQDVTVMDGLHSLPNVAPRAVFNPPIDKDDDYAFAQTLQAPVSGILERLFDNAASELAAVGAAPASGPPYVAADLNPLDYVPQDKIVFESETFRAAIDHVMQPYPQYRLLFHPGLGERHWRFRNATTSPMKTLTLNQFSSPGERVLSMKLARSLERRYGAVKIYGPPRLVGGLVSVSGGGLTKLWDLTQESILLFGGPGTAGAENAAKAWQVADPAKRHLGRLLPAEVAVPSNLVTLAGQSLTFLVTRRPTMSASFDGGVVFHIVEDVVLDTNQGILYTRYPLVRRDPVDGLFHPPTDVRFYFSYHAEPLYVRRPESGYSGTAWSVAGLHSEMRVYDEGLAVGYESFSPVTTPQRLAQFAKLADNLLAAHRDVIYTGQCVLEGLNYELARLNLRLNFAAVGADGAPLPTGWEAIGAILTDVEYDFAERTTSLTLSGDHLEYLQHDVSTLKKLLHIELFEPAQRSVALTATGAGLFAAHSTPLDEQEGNFAIGLS